MVKGYFPVSEQDAEQMNPGMIYEEKRLGVFKTKESVLETKHKHPSGFQTHPVIVEIDIPEDSVRSYPDQDKFSFGPCSGAVIKDLCSIEVFEQRLVMSIV